MRSTISEMGPLLLTRLNGKQRRQQVNTALDLVGLPAGTYVAAVNDYQNNGVIPAYQLRAVVTASCGNGVVESAEASGATLLPRTSVVALGRSPSGTSKTLVGSVPPRPNGTGPVDLVPWVELAALVALSGGWLVRRVGTTTSRVREG